MLFFSAILSALNPTPAASGELVLYLSGETRGNLLPCDCPSAPLGGLDRRVGFFRNARQLHPDALFLDSGGFLPVGEVPLRDDPEAGEELVRILLHSFSRSGMTRIAVEPAVLRFLEGAAPEETAVLQQQWIPVETAAPAQRLEWGGERVALFSVDRSWSDEDLEKAGASARKGADLTIVLARATALDGRRIAQKTGANIVALSRGARPSPPLREGESFIVGPGKLGKEVLEFAIESDPKGGWRTARYIHHPMDNTVQSDRPTRDSVETLLDEFGVGWHVLTTHLSEP